MSNVNDEMKKYSGANSFSQVKYISAPSAKLNGQTGEFSLNKKSGKDTYVDEALGESITGVFLRKRKKLVFWSKKKSESLSSSEYNANTDFITLFQDGKVIDKGLVPDIRTKYQKLKTNEIVYFLLGKPGMVVTSGALNIPNTVRIGADAQLVKLTVKGASLGSESKPKDSVPFYEFLNTFDADEHIWQFFTKITAKAEAGQLGDYYAMSFEKGERIVDEDIEKFLLPEMKRLHEAFQSQDEANQASKGISGKKNSGNNSEIGTDKESSYAGTDSDSKFSADSEDDDTELPAINLDEEEGGIKAEDIPF